MQRRPTGIYEFRRRLPQDLAGRAAPPHALSALAELVNPATRRFKRELTISLRTSDPKKAKALDMREAVRVEGLFDMARRLIKSNGPDPHLPDLPALADIEADFVVSLLKADDEAREHGEAQRHIQTPEERAQWPDLEDVGFETLGLTDIGFDVRGEELEMLSADYRKALAQRRPDIVKAELHGYLKDHGLPIEPTSSFYREAGLAVLRGHVKAYTLMLQRQGGEDVQTPARVVVDRGPKLSEAFKVWRGGSQARGGKQISDSTGREAERAVKYFTEWHGDLRLGDITKEKARDFRNAVATLPTRVSAKHRALPLRQLLKAAKGSEVVHAASVNKYLNLLAAVVSAVERDGMLDKVSGFTNPFHNLSLTIDKRSAKSSRKPFSKDQLAALFANGVFTAGHRPKGGGGEASFWFPLISLLSGARLNEIAQLRVTDLRQDTETGVWFLDIDTEGDRLIKTESSRRQVPVHDELIRLGLLKYREQRRKQAGEAGELWPDVKSANKAYRSVAWSKWFGRYIRETIGIEDTGIVFHSFRHTFKRMARDAHLSEEMHDALTGHSGSGDVGRSYGAGFGLKALAEAMGRIETPSSTMSITIDFTQGNPVKETHKRH